jgi:hypothetical protein
MRRLLVAGLAALAVVLGLVVSTGVASAAPSRSHDVSCTGVALGTCTPTLPNGHTLAPCTILAGATSCSDSIDLGAHLGLGGTVGGPQIDCTVGHHRVGNHCVPDGVGFPHDGHGYPGTWGGPRIDGRYLWLDQNLSLDVCSDTTYGGWYNRNSAHRDGFLRLLGGNPNARWMQLHNSSCGSGVSVSNDGQCVTYRQDALRYGNDLNANRRDWSGLRLRLLSSHHGWNGSDLSLLSLGERNDWNRLSGLDRQRFDNYNRVYSQLRTVCNDPNPQVVILQAPAPVTYSAAPADPSATAPSADDGASKPLASAPLNSALPAPAVAPSNGGDSPAFVLAHARAV